MSCQIRAIFQNKNKKYLPKHINKQNLIFLSLTPFFLCSLSYINVIFFSLILAGSRRKEGRTLSLPSSLPLLSSIYLFCLCCCLARGFSSPPHLSWGFIHRPVQLIPPRIAASVFWLFHRAGLILLFVRRLLPRVGGWFYQSS
jgi:hypothetical protein